MIAFNVFLYQVEIQRTGWTGLQLSSFRARSTAEFGVIFVIAEVCFDDQFAVSEKLIVRTRRMDEHSCNVKKECQVRECIAFLFSLINCRLTFNYNLYTWP